MCQLKCNFCLYSFQDKLKGGWELDDFRMVADKLISFGINRFEFTPSLGEITLDPTWHDKIRYLDGRVDDILIYTNGLKIDEEQIRLLMEMKTPLTLFFSMYGDSQESYLNTTGVDCYEVFFKQVEHLSSFFPLPENKRIGIDIRFKEVEMPLHPSGVNFKNPIWKQLLLYQGQEPNFLLVNRPENSNWAIDFPGLPRPKEKVEFNGACECMNVTLNPNGDALICNICHPYDKRYEVLGNVFTDKLEDIFESFNEVQQKMQAGIIPEICKNCTEYDCQGDNEEYYDDGWKTRPKQYWHK